MNHHERNIIANFDSIYVRHIDGLRALAVSTVLMFHLDKGLLPGGYIGVDIFFVISGFVVTKSVLHVQPASLFEFLRYFYARRIVRIMPALAVCLLVTTLATVLFIPESFSSRSIPITGLSAFFGLSNIILSLQTEDYFSPAAELNPFTHSWSLGVEEQFYLIFPVVIFLSMLRGERRRSRAIAVVGALSIASFLACALLTQLHWKLAFYSLPSRFWELGVGVIACLAAGTWLPALAKLRRSVGEACLACSLALIAAALFIPSSQAFPFPLALLPVLGSCGLILSCIAWPDARLAAPFRWDAVMFLGKISYSLYLWHWPVYVLMRWTVGLDGPYEWALAIAITLCLASASFFLVERPVRLFSPLRRVPHGSVVVAGLLLTSCAAGTTGLMFREDDQLSLSVTAANRADWYPVLDATASPRRCRLVSSHDDIAGGVIRTWTPTDCAMASPAGRLIVIGDSHADSYGPLLSNYSQRSGRIVQLYHRNGCGYLLVRDRADYEAADCVAYARAVTRRLTQVLGAGDVLFLPSLRIARLFTQFGTGERKQADPGRVDRDRAMSLAEARSVIRQVGARGAKIIFEAPKPQFRSLPFRCSDWFNVNNPICRGGNAISRTEIEYLRAPVLQQMAMLSSAFPNISIWDPLPILCPAQVCSVFLDGHPLFFDSHHVSGYANVLLYPSFSRTMNEMFVPHGAGSAKLSGPLPIDQLAAAPTR